MVDMLKQFDENAEAIWMCPIPVRISRIEELVNQYPVVRERISNFFRSDSFEAMFNDMMDFVNTQSVLLGISKEEIDMARDVFMYNIKQNLKINIFVNALARVFTIPGKCWEDIEQELFELTDKTQIGRLMFEYLTHLKRNSKDMICEMLKSDSTTSYTS